MGPYHISNIVLNFCMSVKHLVLTDLAYMVIVARVCIIFSDLLFRKCTSFSDTVETPLVI